jgi:O-antigen/teichoic acid export membrane protein
VTVALQMKRIGRHTLVYGVGIVLGKVLSFVMLPFYTHYLTPADYGVMQLVELTLDIVAILAGTRISGGIFKYYQEATSEAGRRAVLSTAMFLLVSSFSVLAVVTGLLAPLVSRIVFGVPDQAMLIRLAAASMGVSSFVTAPFALLRLQEESVRWTALTTAKLFIQLTLNVLFLAGFKLGVTGVFTSTLIANVALALWMTYPFLRQVGLGFSGGTARQLLRYGIPLVGTHVATFIATFGDRYFLRVSGNMTAVGLYSLAYQFGFILAILGGMAFTIMWEPMRFQVAKRADRDQLYARAFIYLNLLLLSMAVGIALAVGDFIRVMADPAYRGASALVPLILVAYVIQTWASFQETGVLVSERTEYITLANWLAALTALAGYALLIPRWLGWGAAVATVLSFSVRLIVTHVSSQRLFHITLSWRPVWRTAAAGTAIVLASIALPTLPLAVSILVRAGLFGIYLLLVWFSDVVPADDRRRLFAAVGALVRRDA